MAQSANCLLVLSFWLLSSSVTITVHVLALVLQWSAWMYSKPVVNNSKVANLLINLLQSL